jgi:hypothetical protein
MIRRFAENGIKIGQLLPDAPYSPVRILRRMVLPMLELSR